MKTFQPFLFAFLFLTISFCSCNRQSNQPEKLAIVPENVVEIESLRGKIVQMVSLSDHEGQPYSHIVKSIYNDGSYYLQVGFRRSELVIHDLKGAFISRVGGFGKGPGEYTNVSDFSVCRKTGNVFILDNNWEIQEYSSKGDFLKSISLKFGAESFEKAPDGWHMYMSYNNGTNPNRLITVDENFKIRKEYFNEPVQLLPVPGSAFSSDNNVTYFKEEFSNTVYSVQSNGIHPYLIFDWGVKNFKDEYLNIEPFEVMEKTNQGEFYMFKSFLKKDDFFYACFADNGNQRLFHIFKKRKKPNPIVFSTGADQGFWTALNISSEGELVFAVPGLGCKALIEDNPLLFDEIIGKGQDVEDDKLYLLFLSLDSDLG